MSGVVCYKLHTLRYAMDYAIVALGASRTKKTSLNAKLGT